MNLPRTAAALVVVALWTVPAMAQVRLRCLHGDDESTIQMQRRIEALDASDLINRVLVRKQPSPGYPSWEDLAKSDAVTTYRRLLNGLGELARKIEWGTNDPLPGWRMHYVATETAYSYWLTDMRDPCQFTFASNESALVIEGRPARMARPLRVVPLDSTR